MTARMLLRVDAFGCTAATVVAVARDGWAVAALLAVSAVVIGAASAVPDRRLSSVTREVGILNCAWAAGVAVVIAAGWVSGVDAVLLGLTAPYCAGLGALQLRSAAGQRVASAV